MTAAPRTDPAPAAEALDQYEAGDGSDNAACRVCRDWGTVIHKASGTEVPCPAPECQTAPDCAPAPPRPRSPAATAARWKGNENARFGRRPHRHRQRQGGDHRGGPRRERVRRVLGGGGRSTVAPDHRAHIESGYFARLVEDAQAAARAARSQAASRGWDTRRRTAASAS
ncbi:hypothetical protein ACFQ9X_57165 [Catenulispora yoronensis]